MSKIEDFLSQQIFASLPSVGGAPGSNAPAPVVPRDNADQQLGVHSDLHNDEPQTTKHEAHGNQSATDLKQQLQSRMPLAGQMLRHNLQTFDKALPKFEQKHDSANENRAPRDERGLPKSSEKNNSLIEATIKTKHVEVEARVPQIPLKVVQQSLLKHAEKAGLPINEQKDFADKFAKKFEAEAKNATSGNAFSTFNNARATVRVKINGNEVNVRLGAEAAADLRGRAVKLNINPKETGEINFKINQNAAQPNSAATKQQPTNAALPNQAQAARQTFANLSANAASSNLRQLQILSRRDVAELRMVLNNKIADVLQRLGIDVSELKNKMPGEFGADGKTPQEMREMANIFGGGSAQAEDDALFASALGIAAESAGESRALNGDGLLLEFANYGEAKDAFAFESTVQKLLENGSQIGLEQLLEVADADLSNDALDGLTQLAADSSADSVNDLVVGVLTMSVMTREVLERLDHISSGANLGLSEDAMTALQKAQNNLRDHLTATDIIGATGDAKGTPISIKGETYSFLPEVTEALNSLRDARQRILNETSGNSGIESFGRFSVEADALFKITRNVESLIKS